MFDQTFGEYLVASEKLTHHQLHDVINSKKNTRIKLGFIAINKGYITEAQAKTIHTLQKKKDLRFGDIALSQGFLTKAQLDSLLQEQGVSSLAFLQTIIEKGYMTLSQIHESIRQFKIDRKMSDAEYEDLYSDDITRIVHSYFKLTKTDPKLDAKKDAVETVFKFKAVHNKYEDFEPILPFQDYFTLFLRNIIRFVSSDLKVFRPEKIASYNGEHMIYQYLKGNTPLFIAIASNKKLHSLLHIASGFAEETFIKMDEDSIDSIGEFLNCVNGLFVTEFEDNRGIMFDLTPQEYRSGCSIQTSKPMYKLPIYINYKQCDLIVCIGGNPFQ